jgi:hypothetical protein
MLPRCGDIDDHRFPPKADIQAVRRLAIHSELLHGRPFKGLKLSVLHFLALNLRFNLCTIIKRSLFLLVIILFVRK